MLQKQDVRCKKQDVGMREERSSEIMGDIGYKI